jgi:hypothetical protein
LFKSYKIIAFYAHLFNAFELTSACQSQQAFCKLKFIIDFVCVLPLPAIVVFSTILSRPQQAEHASFSTSIHQSVEPWSSIVSKEMLRGLSSSSRLSLPFSLFNHLTDLHSNELAKGDFHRRNAIELKCDK